MGKEIEAKFRVDDEQAFRESLQRLGANYKGAWCETDVFFDHPNERLIEQDMALRMRLDVPLDDAARQCHLLPRLTYKGRRQTGALKIRPEHEVTVPDVSGMRQVLHWLNYMEVFCYQKTRRKWQCEGCEVTLDDVPLLGLYAEVEGPDEQTVNDVLRKLGRDDGQTLTTSYVHLLHDKLGDMQPNSCVYADGRTAELHDYLRTLDSDLH